MIKKTFANDLMALGGLPLYLILIVRAIIGQYAPFITQLVIGLIGIYMFSMIFKESNKYIARAFVLVIFTSYYYKEFLFTTMVSIIWIFMIFAAYYLNQNKKKIIYGIFSGIIFSIISYFITNLII